MIKFCCRLADINFEINALYEYTRDFCRDYLTDGKPDVCISVTQDDIDAERGFSDAAAMQEHGQVIHFSDAYLETLAVYRKICTAALDFDTLLFHSSAICLDGEGYLFTARSGTGKSTHSRLWREMFGERAFMVNDDKPLVKVSDAGVFVCGTPWNGKHRLDTNAIVPIKAICIVTRDSVNHIEPVGARDIFPAFMQQVFIPDDAENGAKAIALMSEIINRVPVYRLGCNMELDAARVSYEGMRK